MSAPPFLGPPLTRRLGVAVLVALWLSGVAIGALLVGLVWAIR